MLILAIQKQLNNTIMKTTYSYQVYAWGERSNVMRLFGSYHSRALAFSHARELYYVGVHPVFIVALPYRSVRDDYSPFCWQCVGTPRFESEVVIDRVSVVEFLSFLNI